MIEIAWHWLALAGWVVFACGFASGIVYVSAPRGGDEVLPTDDEIKAARRP